MFAMREAAPFLFDKFDVASWLDSSSAGKRLAAVKYLDWLEDIEFMNNLIGKLATERPSDAAPRSDRAGQHG